MAAGDVSGRVSELSRQYQIAQEHLRWGRGQLGHVLSAEDDITRARQETVRLHGELTTAWLEHLATLGGEMSTTPEVSGYDSVADTAAEWRLIIPESSTFKGVIGSYGNGQFANTTVAKQAFGLAKHVVYDVDGKQPSDDLLDVEPKDAPPNESHGWSHAHNQTPGPHVLRAPGLYCSASTSSAVISDMLDNGWKRTDFILQSAHYGAGAHICGPDTCGFPQADSTQHADKGLKGQNTDLNLWAGHCFQTPAPDPDARYGLFDNVKRSLIGRSTERATVQEYDKWRAMQTKTSHPHRVRLALLRVRLGLLAGRLDRVIRSEKGKLHPNQAWRLRELQDRRRGMRLV